MRGRIPWRWATPLALVGVAVALGGERPDLVFEEMEAHWGMIVQGETATHSFTFRNAGGRTLSLLRVQTSCDCTAAPLERRDYPPGASGAIVVTFDSAGRGGEQEHEILVHSNDPEETWDGLAGVTRLVFRGGILEFLRALPPSVYIPGHDLGTAQERRVRIQAGERIGPSRFELTAVESSSPHVSAEAVRRGPAEWEVVLRVLPTAPLGPYRAEVVVRTDQERQSTLHLHVAGEVLGDVAVGPREVHFGEVERGGGAERRVGITSRRGRGLRVLDLVQASAFVAAEVVTLVEGRSHELVLRPRPDAPAGPFAARVRVLLDDPDEPCVDVRVLGEVLPEVVALPPAVYLEGAPARVDLAHRRGEAFAVKGVEVEGEGVAAVLEGARSVVVRRAGEGRASARVVVSTDVPGQPTVVIEVRGE
ncbi:MAG: DUF1573 domain-containing protein [Planctomycetes bacterium]|nr:DUF1573 domain-containing protein [Planctomycetota bacterium]